MQTIIALITMKEPSMLTPFETAHVKHFAARPTFGNAVTETLSRDSFDQAEQEITCWSGYKKTPLFPLVELARTLSIGEIHYKHEGPRFGLGSFKALGGAYAVLRVLQREMARTEDREIAIDDIRNDKYATQTKSLTVISATDGNHGLSVAWGAARFGARCRIYIHAEVSEYRAEAMRKLGAEVIRVDGDYDATVAQSRIDADKHGWLIVSDTSWPGYTQAPRDVMAGYGVMAREIVRDMPRPPTHVFLQGGVGGLAAAVAAVFRQEWAAEAPRVIVVEPEFAPCLFASAKAGVATSVKIQSETIMAGLSCGEPSEIAWSVLADVAQDFITIPDDIVAPAVRMLANSKNAGCAIEAGESAVAGLCGLISAAVQGDLREILNLGDDSIVVIIGSEGVTDPDIFKNILSGDS